jgi:hypothetical protein
VLSTALLAVTDIECRKLGRKGCAVQVGPVVVVGPVRWGEDAQTDHEKNNSVLKVLVRTSLCQRLVCGEELAMGISLMSQSMADSLELCSSHQNVAFCSCGMLGMRRRLEIIRGQKPPFRCWGRRLHTSLLAIWHVVSLRTPQKR